jgi:hypothetical protein
MFPKRVTASAFLLIGFFSLWNPHAFCGNQKVVQGEGYTFVSEPPELNAAEKRMQTPEIIETKTVVEDNYTRTVVTPGGHYLRLAKDRPIEKFAGYQGGIGLDSYVYHKFSELRAYLDERFDKIEARLTGIEKGISELKAMVQSLERLISEKSEFFPAETA